MFEKINDLVENMVAVEDGVVISIKDFLASAVLKLVGMAKRCELSKGFWCPQEVIWPVTAMHMQNDNQPIINRVAFNFVVEFVEQYFVITLIIIAQFDFLQVADIIVFDSFTYALATGIVVSPKYIKAGMHQNIEQVFMIGGIRC